MHPFDEHAACVAQRKLRSAAALVEAIKRLHLPTNLKLTQGSIPVAHAADRHHDDQDFWSQLAVANLAQPFGAL